MNESNHPFALRKLLSWRGVEIITKVASPRQLGLALHCSTQAKIENLRRAGYNADFTPLEQADSLRFIGETFLSDDGN